LQTLPVDKELVERLKGNAPLAVQAERVYPALAVGVPRLSLPCSTNCFVGSFVSRLAVVLVLEPISRAISALVKPGRLRMRSRTAVSRVAAVASVETPTAPGP
jgi:hypothetical protein